MCRSLLATPIRAPRCAMTGHARTSTGTRTTPPPHTWLRLLDRTDLPMSAWTVSAIFDLGEELRHQGLGFRVRNGPGRSQATLLGSGQAASSAAIVHAAGPTPHHVDRTPAVTAPIVWAP